MAVKDIIIETIIEGEKGIKESQEKLDFLKNKRKSAEDAIKTFESEGVVLPEMAYGLVAHYDVECNREEGALNALTKIIKKIKEENGYTIYDKADYISRHSGKYTWVDPISGELRDDDGIVLDY